MPVNKAFTSVAENKAFYANNNNPVEYNYNYKLVKPERIVIPIKNTKKILALKGTGGGQ